MDGVGQFFKFQIDFNSSNMSNCLREVGSSKVIADCGIGVGGVHCSERLWLMMMFDCCRCFLSRGYRCLYTYI